VTVEQVQAATGTKLIVNGAVPTMAI
jgi:hypothetical protein